MKKIIFILIIVEILLIRFYLSESFFYKTPLITFLFDLDKEGSIANFFSGLLLFAISSILLLKKTLHLNNFPLKFFGLLFLFLGIDEITAIHETIGLYLHQFDWFPKFNQNFGEWIILYLSFGLLIFIIFFKTILNIFYKKPYELKIISLGIILALIGGFCCEFLSFKLNIRNEASVYSYRLLVAIEEFLEMFGLTIILFGVLKLFHEKNEHQKIVKSIKKCYSYADIKNDVSFRKSSLFFIFQFWIFFLISFYYSPRLLSFLAVAPNFFSIFGILIFVIIFNMFFYYIVFNILSIIFSNIVRNKYSEKVKNYKINDLAKIAVLYLTKDDFNENACASCLTLDYDNYEVFILDDSVLNESKSLIDSFVSKNNKVKLIRRVEKTGFKAGNINHGLRLIEEHFDFFAITDSDGILQKDFIKGLLKYFHLDSSIGFVQALCASNPKQESLFAKDMSAQIDIHWRHFIPYHNSFGFVMFYGHSALIKTSLWKEIGGFPEVVSEDLWFSFKVREKGYQGIFANDVITYEDVPECYSRFRRRHEKWVRGTAEFLKKNILFIFKNKNISHIEKFDLFSSNFSMLMSAPFILFILIIAFMLPFYFQAFNLAGAAFTLPIVSAGKKAGDYLSGFRYNMYYSLDFFCIVALGILYPIIPTAFELWKKPFRFLNYIFISTGIYTSLTVSSALSILSFFLTGKTFFPVTGEPLQYNKEIHSLFDFRSTSIKVQVLEIVIGIILIFVSIKSHNFWFLPIAVSSLSVPFLINTLNYKHVKWIVYIPFLLQSLLLLLIFKNFVF